MDGSMVLDEALLSSLTNTNNPIAHVKALQYFEELKNSDKGWEACMSVMVSKRYATVAQVQFFCLQVIEHFVKTRYANAPPAYQETVRTFCRNWVKFQFMPDDSTLQEPFILNKAAQISALVFVQDFPSRWPDFFNDHFSAGVARPQYMEHYLRVLIAIDSEVADKEVPRSAGELIRNSSLKDAMREKAVFDLVESWYKILTGLNGRYPILARLCLQVIGKYIQWIDINLVANDRFVPVFVADLGDPEVREDAADCIEEVISKGMDPIDKTKLVQSFSGVLGSAGVWNAFPTDQDEDYLCRLGKLFGTMGTSLIESYSKFAKYHPGQEAELKVMCDAIEEKIPLLLQILENDCDDVSATVLDFVRDYLHLIKSFRQLSETQVNNYKQTLGVVINKLKFDTTYNFAHEGEDEACFMEYRKQLKVIFDNLAQLDKVFLMTEIQNRILYICLSWKSVVFTEIEVSLLLLYYLGEHVPTIVPGEVPQNNNLPSMEKMMSILVASDIYQHEHPVVALQYFEVVVRYEKFFINNPESISTVLYAFVKEKGLFHSDKKVRSRVCYLFSRFIKCIRSNIPADLIKVIVDSIRPLLTLQPMPKDANCDCLIIHDDQLYLYEIIGVLIVAGAYENQKKTAFMADIVKLILMACRHAVEKIRKCRHSDEQEVNVELLVQAIAVTGRLSKAFSSTTTMKSLACVQIFLDALGVFLEMLHLPIEEVLMAELQSSIRQYMHRLVVCLEEEILPYIPAASQGLLRNCDGRSIQEYIPLINQVINKYKKDVLPFLKQMFAPMVQGVFRALQVPVEPNDQQALRDRQLLRRNYFQFLNVIVVNQVTDVMATQDPNVLQEVMMSVIQSTVENPDPVAHKLCFSIMKALVDLWAVPEGPAGFLEFMYSNIMQACFACPLKDFFDINDAQTVLVVYEISAVLRAILEKRDKEFLVCLSNYLPTLEVPQDKVVEFVAALQTDNKNFKIYFRQFIVYLKSITSVIS